MIKSFISKNALQPSVASHSALSLTIVNTADCGKRIKLSKGILLNLGNPSDIGFAPNGDKSGLILYADPDKGFHLSKGNVIYSATLVEQLTNLFALDFKDTISQTFVNITMKHDDEDNMDYADIVLKEGGAAHDNS